MYGVFCIENGLNFFFFFKEKQHRLSIYNSFFCIIHNCIVLVASPCFLQVVFLEAELTGMLCL